MEVPVVMVAASVCAVVAKLWLGLCAVSEGDMGGVDLELWQQG